MNKVMLIGNVGQEPQVKYLETGLCVAQLRLATTEKGYTLQNGTQVPDRTEWHNLVFWKGLAETVEKYVHKGDKLYVEGKIQSRSWDDKQGARHTQIDIVVDNMEMLSGRRDHSAAHAQQPSGSSTETQSADTAKPAEQSTVVTPNDNSGEYPF